MVKKPFSCFIHSINRNICSDSQMTENKDSVRNTDKSQRSSSTNGNGNLQNDSVTHDLGAPKLVLLINFKLLTIAN